MSRGVKMSPLVLGGVGVALLAVSLPGDAAKTRRRAKAKPVRLALNGELPPPRRAAAKNVKPLPRYVSLQTIETLRALRESSGRQLLPVLQPFEGDRPLRTPLANLMNGPVASSVNLPALPKITGPASLRANKQVRRRTRRTRRTRTNNTQYQPFPIPIPPAAIPRARAPIVPRFVRYPLEFQLCGISLGIRAVDKDRFNRIDRYGLFALHGNPSAIVVPSAGGGTVTVAQVPPEVNSPQFPPSDNGYLPAWAEAVNVNLDNNHVQYLYQRPGYSMGFVVDRLGYVDAIVVAGTTSPIARTQLEDPVHTVRLGDDFRKVVFRYGYPDTIETYGVSAVASAGGGATGGAATPGDAASAQGQGLPPGARGPGAGNAGGRGASPSSVPGAGAGGAGGAEGAGGQAGGNSAYRTFELRYEQSYNVVFTIRNNRVVRIYIFGDPDFFNNRRRNNLRTRY